MVKVLLDTNVLSEIMHPRGDLRVKVAVAQISQRDVYLSVMTIAEIAKGAVKLGSGQRRTAIEAFLSRAEVDYGERILSVDLQVARVWAELDIRTRRSGDIVPVIDGLIAATALVHGLTVVTRNVDDFVPTGVAVFNPWEVS